jgi:hypothetical protein
MAATYEIRAVPVHRAPRRRPRRRNVAGEISGKMVVDASRRAATGRSARVCRKPAGRSRVVS